jgi:hypothetical protein
MADTQSGRRGAFAQVPWQPAPDLETTLGTIGDLGYAATGIPLGLEGYDQMTGPEAGYGDMALGAGKMGLAALPWGGPVARAAFATAPRAATVGGAYGLLGMGDEAEAASKAKAAPEPLPTPDAEGLVNGLLPDQYLQLQQLNKKVQQGNWNSGAERRTIENQIKTLQDSQAANIRGRLEAKRAIEAQGASAAQALKDKEAAATQEKEQAYKDANTPLKEKYPWLGYAIPGIAGALSFGSAALLRGRGIKQTKTALNDVTGRLESTIASRETARKAGDIPRALEAHDIAKALSQEQGALNKSAGAFFGPGSGSALAAGATFGVAGKVLPDEIDAQRALPGSPLEESVKSRWDSWPEVAGNIGIGLASGLSTGEMGSVARKSLSKPSYFRSFEPEIKAFDERAAKVPKTLTADESSLALIPPPMQPKRKALPAPEGVPTPMSGPSKSAAKDLSRGKAHIRWVDSLEQQLRSGKSISDASISPNRPITPTQSDKKLRALRKFAERKGIDGVKLADELAHLKSTGVFKKFSLTASLGLAANAAREKQEDE